MISTKYFWKNSVIYGISSIMIKTISLLLLPLYTNAFSQKEAGHIFLLFTLIAFTQLIYNFGFDSSFLQFYNISKPNNENKNYNYSVGCTALISLIIISLFFSILIFLFSKQISFFFLGFENKILIQISAFILFFETISSKLMILLRVKEKVKQFFYINLIHISVSVFMSIVLVIYYEFKITGIFIGSFLGSLIHFLLVFPLLIKTIKKGFFSYDLFKRMIKFGFPFIPATFFYIILEMSDRLMIFWLIGPEAVGLYSVGYKLGSIGLFIIIAFNLGWQPFYLKLGNKKTTGYILGKIGTTFIHILVIIWVLVVFWSPTILRIKFGENMLIGDVFLASEVIIPIIFLSYLFYGGYIILMPSIFLLEKQKWAPIFRGSAALINIFFNIILIRYWGIFGASISTLIAYVMMFIFLYYKSNKWLKILCDWKSIGRHFIISIIFILIYLMAVQNGINSIILTFFYLITLFLIFNKIYSIKNLKNMISIFNEQ